MTNEIEGILKGSISYLNLNSPVMPHFNTYTVVDGVCAAPRCIVRHDVTAAQHHRWLLMRSVSK